jgi:predicted Fe-Mo cluster-binding NifX family protein
MNKMRYAITMENNMVFQHFGKCPSFLLVNMENGEIVSKEVLSSGGSGHGALATLLAQANVDTLICGGIGQGARDALAQNNIQVIAGANGNVDVIIDALKAGTLKDDPSGSCNHHHEEGHTCGDHSEGGCHH